MVDFAGYSMPVQYPDGVLAEHRRVRSDCGLFDISHMGELWVRGPGSRDALDRLVTNNVDKLAPGRVLYSAMCKEDGGILDDVLVYCKDDETFMIVVNASNRDKVVGWVADHLPAAVDFVDESDDTCLIALQGPSSPEVLAHWPRLAPQLSQVASLGYYHLVEVAFDDGPCIISRTGYTGERGYEIYVPSGLANEVWEELLTAGSGLRIAPIGLGARDTLRLEAAFSLYGHELDEQHTPSESGIGWVVRLKAGDFIGRDALVRQKESGASKGVAGFRLAGRQSAREGAPIFAGEELVGEVTSGSFSPTLEYGIALGRVVSPAEDRALEVEIRGRRLPLQQAELPFVPSRVKDSP